MIYVSSNFRRKITTRYFVGSGITWQLINKPIHTLKLSVSAVFEQTKFNGNKFNFPALNGNNNISLWRGTLYAAGWSHLFHKRLRLYYDAFWQPAFIDRNNYRTQFDIGFDFPLWKGLSFTTLYTFTHDNVVVSTIKKEDKILTFGIAYNFKKR